MPMYEYGCAECATRFDLLRRMDQDDTGILCPQCGSEHVHRKLSVCASFSKDSSSPASTVMAGGGGGCCGGGGCACGARN